MKRSGLLFLIGCICYPAIELLWRGRTHPTMALAGGICLYLTDKLSCIKTKHTICLRQCTLCAGVITLVELIFGFFLNIICRRNVWDYSDLPANFMGQICLPFSVGWFFLSVPMVGLCRLFRKSQFLCKEKGAHL